MTSSRVLLKISLGLAICGSLAPALLSQSTFPGDRSRRRSPGGTDAQSRQSARLPGQRGVFIRGSVVQSEGTPVGEGAVIESVCGGRTRKESYVDPRGGFAFQVGLRGGLVQDASDDSAQSAGMAGLASGRVFSGAMGQDASSTLELSGCDLRARLAGYRSSAVTLDNTRWSGDLDVGTIVLYPTAKVQGTTVSVTSMQAPKKARKAQSRAVEALRRKDLKNAERYLHKALDAFPRFAEAWLQLGNIHQAQLRLDEARAEYRKAIEVDASFVKPYIELGRLEVLKKDWAEAARLTEKALLLDPVDFPEGYLINSLAKLNLDKLEESEASALKAQRLDGLHRFPSVYIVMAGLRERKNDIPGAVAELRKYLEYAPGASNADQVRARIDKLERQSAER